jgi:hypothetical protein
MEASKHLIDMALPRGEPQDHALFQLHSAFKMKHFVCNRVAKAHFCKRGSRASYTCQHRPNTPEDASHFSLFFITTLLGLSNI